MQIIKYSEHEDIDKAIKDGDPVLAVIPFDCKKAYIGHIDECFEHHILLKKAGNSGTEIDKYFRIILAGDGVNWTFVCPPDYKNIKDKTKRLGEFYRDGFAAISGLLADLNIFTDIKIPERYRRHENNNSLTLYAF